MLTISVEWLHGTLRAGSVDDLAVTGALDPGDWPPSPARLFGALVAADGTGKRTRVTTGDELLTLERAKPPRIFADRREDVCMTQLVPRYVVADGTADGTVQNYPARTSTMVRPGTRLAPRVPHVTYVWDDVEVSDDELAALRARAARIGYVGCSDSPARVRVTDGPPETTGSADEWIPDPEGEASVPVTFPGTVAVLDRMFEQFTAGMPVRRSWYRTEIAGYRTPTQMRVQPAVEPWPLNFWLRLESPLPARRALDVAEALKAATLSTFEAANGLISAEVPAILHGHMPAEARGYQLAQWTALPNVGSEHADGRLHGALVSLPSATDPVTVQRIGKALSSVQVLRLPGGRSVGIQAAGALREKWAVMPRRWRGPARLWVSALPAVFERRRRPSQMHDEVSRWCHHAGFPTPVWMEISSLPLLPGAQTLAPSEVFRNGHGERRPYRHVGLLFDREVTGPMVLGRGRQYGMGLMVPQPTTRS